MSDRQPGLAQDGALLGRLTRIAVETVLAFCAARAGRREWARREERRGHRRAENVVRLATQSTPPHDRSRRNVAQERVEQRADGLVRITLKKAYSDRTIAVEMDPLSLLCRLATSVLHRGSTP